MADKWSDNLQQKSVAEFSFFPQAYTPLKENGFELPFEVEFDGGDDSSDNSKDPNAKQTPSWVKNISFTIGGMTIGAAAVYGLFMSNPPPAPSCPALPMVSHTTQTSAAPVGSQVVPKPQSTVSSSSQPRSTGVATTSSSSAGTP